MLPHQSRRCSCRRSRRRCRRRRCRRSRRRRRHPKSNYSAIKHRASACLLFPSPN